ncbi:MAG TPA: TolC family protein [Gemmatales bacterium]|nr:TolC family protein [Gemmatales bacterium]
MTTFICREWRIWAGSLLFLASIVSGCASHPSDCILAVNPPSSALLGPIETNQVNLTTPSETLQGPLTIQRALEVSLQRHPDLAAAAAAIAVAQGNVVQAGLYPNPVAGFIGDQIGSRGGPGGQQGPFISQEVVTGGKLQASQSAASEALTATQWQAITKRFELETKVRSAFYEVLTAQREVSENETIVKIASENYDASQKIEKAGRGSQPDVLRARVELESNQNRLIAAKKRLEASWPLLANTMGMSGVAFVPLEGDLESTKPNYQVGTLQETVLSNNSELMQWQASIGEAEKLATRARLENVPNVDLKVHPLYDYTESIGQISFEVGMRMPIWNKNQGNIQAAEAELIRRNNELQTTKLKLSDRVITAHQRFITAREQAVKFEKDLLPQAKEALRLTKAAFESGDAKYDYTALLDAQRTLAQARLSYVQTLGELWRAVAEIEGLLQRP